MCKEPHENETLLTSSPPLQGLAMHYHVQSPRCSSQKTKKTTTKCILPSAQKDTKSTNCIFALMVLKQHFITKPPNYTFGGADLCMWHMQLKYKFLPRNIKNFTKSNPCRLSEASADNAVLICASDTAALLISWL